MSRMLPLRFFSLSKSHVLFTLLPLSSPPFVSHSNLTTRVFSLAHYSPVYHLLCRSHGCSRTQTNGLLQNPMGLSKSRKIHHETRTFCTASELATKKCVPCNSKDMRAMAEELANELITKVPDWKLVHEGNKLKLSRSWKVNTFTKGLEFFKAIADVAEAEGHHPDLHLVGWNNVTVDIWTHSVGGLTENDFILAAKIDNLDLAHLLRIKPSK